MGQRVTVRMKRIGGRGGANPAAHNVISGNLGNGVEINGAGTSGNLIAGDLIGLDAEDTAGKALGTVVAVHNFGAGDLLEIAPAGGGETVMMPFTAAIVPVVEMARGRIVVDAPPGLLEPDAAETGAPSRIRGGEAETGG